MIQDIFPHEFSNKYITVTNISENDYIFYFNGNHLLMKQNGEELSVPKRNDLKEFDCKGTFLFTFNNINCFMVWDDPNCNNEQFCYHEIHFRNFLLKREIDWITCVALQLNKWYVQHTFCGKCGGKTIPKEDERAISCPSCQVVTYPTISPAIIVAIINNNKIMLARGANFPMGYFSLVAGYVDIGETIEEAIKREVREEVGLKVKNIRYYKSQPWPFSGSMMIGFIAELDGDSNIQVDGKEILEAAWFNKGGLPNYPPDRSIAGEMIDKFKNGEDLMSIPIIENS